MADEQSVLSSEEKEMTERKEDSESDEESEEEESDDEDYFEVEKIMARKKRDGVFLYRVRWKGYPPSNDTWEPVGNLDIVSDMVQEFDAKEDQKAKARQEERRIRKLRMEGKKLPGEESSDDSSNSSDEERLLCEDTKFFNMLEKNKQLVFVQPDLYSKVKSRAATLANKKKTDDQIKEPPVQVVKPETPKQPAESSEERGRGRPKGSTAQEKGSSRGRGRPPKKISTKSSDEDDAGAPATQQKSSGRGRGRPRKKPVGDSSGEEVFPGDSVPQPKSAGRGRGRPPKKLIKENAEKDSDSDDSVPSEKTGKRDQKGGSKKSVIDSSDEDEDSGSSISEEKGDSHREKTPDKTLTDNSEEKEDSDDSVQVIKKVGKGRGRPRKTPLKGNTDKREDLDKKKSEGKRRGRPPKKVEGNSEKLSANLSSSQQKIKGKGRGRPRKKVIESDSEKQDSDDHPHPESAPQDDSKSSTKPKEKSLEKKDVNESEKSESKSQKDSVSYESEEEEESDISVPPVKKFGKSKGRAQKKPAIEHSESDDSALHVKTSGKGQSKSKKKPITETSDESDASDTECVRKDEVKKQNTTKKASRPGLKKGGASEDSDDSVSVMKTTSKGRGRPRKKLVIKDSEDSVSDNSLPSNESPIPDRSPGKSKTESKAVQKKKSAKIRKKLDTTSESESEKPITEFDNDRQINADTNLDKKASLETVSNTELSKSESQVAKHEVALKPINSEFSLGTVKDHLIHTSAGAVKPAVHPVRPKAVIPVLEKLALGSMSQDLFSKDISDSFDKNEGGNKEQKTSIEKKTSGEKKMSVEKEKASSRNETKETGISVKKQVDKGNNKKGAQKRKQSTAVKHVKAVKEGEASPAKILSLPSSGPVDSQSTPNKTSTPRPSPSQEAGLPKTDVEVAKLTTISAIPRKVTSETKGIPGKISSQKSESPKLHRNSPKLKTDPLVMSDKQKLKKDAKLDSESYPGPSPTRVDKLLSVPTFSSDDGLQSSVLNVNTTPSVSNDGKATVSRKDTYVKPVSVMSDKQSLVKPDLATRPQRPEVTEPKSVRPDLVKPLSQDKVGKLEQEDSKSSKLELDRKYRINSADNSSSRDSMSSMSSMFMSSPGRRTPNSGREPLLATPVRDSSGVFSSPSANRDALSPFLSNRDLGRGAGSSISPRNQQQTSGSPRDSQFSSVSSKDLLGSVSSRETLPISGASRDIYQTSGSSRDLHLSSGYSHLSPGTSSLLSSKVSLYSRDLKDSWASSSRHDLNANISGKETVDKLFSPRSMSMPSQYRRGGDALSRETLQSSGTGEKSKQQEVTGIDAEFSHVLRTVDLDYVEKLWLPPPTPMELSHEELRQAIIDGNSYLVERALKYSKSYKYDLPDNKGYTLLMNAVLRGCDDIIVHLLDNGASAQAQVNGMTALMLAVEHAECSTVYLLLEMGARVNTADHSGETALFKAVRRGDKQILKLILDHGADFNLTSRDGLTPLQMAKQFRLADIDTTLIEHIQRVVKAFEEQVNMSLEKTARLVSTLFSHHCVPCRENDAVTIPFQYHPPLVSGPDTGCILFIAHAVFDGNIVKCRLYGQCAVERVTLNRWPQHCLSEESNFVFLCSSLIAGWNELVIDINKDAASKAKLIICAYRVELLKGEA